MSTPVAPAETRPARLRAIPRLPVFLELTGKDALVTGGGPGSAWKAELLAAAGARVTVHADEVSPELAEVAQACAGVSVTARPWTDDDLAAAAIAIGGEPGDAAERLATAARRLRVAVNVIDTGPLCDFTFGAIVERSPIVVAISSDGGSPVLAQAIRRRIEAVLPPALGLWAAAAKRARGAAARLIPDRAARRRFWEAAAVAAFAPVKDADPDAALARLAAQPHAPGGEIVIVGAGPGDPDLVTLAAVRELQAADVIFHDRLVGPQVLELARREARRVLVGKTGRGAYVPQEAITAALIAEARGGARVVRLKGGDPAYFARTGEEAGAARAAGIPVRIVPGVTAASAAAAAMGVSLTDRTRAHRVQFLSGHDVAGALPGDLPLGDAATTTIVYMGRGTAARIADAARAQGRAGTTPVLIASDVGGAREVRVRTDLDGLARAAVALDPDLPALIMIGAALGADAATTEVAEAA